MKKTSTAAIPRFRLLKTKLAIGTISTSTTDQSNDAWQAKFDGFVAAAAKSGPPPASKLPEKRVSPEVIRRPLAVAKK